MAQNAYRVRTVLPPQIIRVNQATWIPSGMHGVPEHDQRSAASIVAASLVAQGVPRARAFALVERARSRIPFIRETRIRFGLGDDQPASVSPDVLSHASDTQDQHKSLLDRYGATTDATTRKAVRDAIEALYNDWTAYAVDVEGGAPPYQWSRTDPTAAVLIAVRDDLRGTIDLIDTGKAQAALQKYISASWKATSGAGLPTMPSLPDVPWYVWTGAAVGAAAIGGKALHLW